jgi:hypothetical protein
MFIYTNKQLHVPHRVQQAIDYNINNAPPANYTGKPEEVFFLEASHQGACGQCGGISDPLKRKAVRQCHAFDSWRRHTREVPL